jgi:hypothetical protein
MTDLFTRAPAPGAAAWPTADEIALQELRETWEPIYDTGIADGKFCAFRWPDGPLITADTLDGLESAIRADWARSR